jgi:dipeptidyl aminopeptidase/acylaminoacyl peptidase
VYRVELGSGLLSQLSDFREGKKRDDEEKGSDQEEWLKQEELRLFKTLQEQKSRREREEQLEEQLEPRRPQVIYTGSQSVQGLYPSPDGKHICFVLADRPEPGGTEIPNYVTESGYTESVPSREKSGSPTSSYQLGIHDLTRDTVYYVSVDSLPGIATPPAYLAEYARADSVGDTADTSSPSPRSVYYGDLVWSRDGRRCVVDIRAQDFKDRWLARLNLDTGTLTTLDHQHDEAWIGGPGVGWRASLGWFPDGRTLWFQSEASGYSHLYTVNEETGERTQRTSGAWEVDDAFLSRDGKYWYFRANLEHSGDWQFYRLSTSKGEPERLTSGQGEHHAYLSPDEKTLAILSSTGNRPTQLFLQDNRPGAVPRAVTESISQEFLSYPWRETEIVYLPASDGARVPARIFRPRQPVTGGPGVIFVHGAGYLQEVTYGWSGYVREYMFHNLLADRGYTVLDIDYRGSSGYGRDWRTAIYRHMGGRDLEDQVDGARYLVSACGVDSARIGIYGGSYGGFITLMALFKHPGVFACGAALRSVTDWAHYSHWYTARILNTPQTDSLAYVRSSPIYFAEGLADPLLMCHSILDYNVHFQDIVRLTQRLIELGKTDWELAVYPLEDHSIESAEAWTDEYRRIFELFEEHLNKK